MPLFALVARDKPNMLDTRLSTRPDHVAHLQGLGAGLKLAGPVLDGDGKPNGSLVVFEAADEAEAQRFADGDPYAKAGVFEEVRIQPYNAALGEWPSAPVRDEEE